MAGRRGVRGVTYLELIATASIIGIFAGAVMPLAKHTRIRFKELELRRALRDIREAIDKYEKTFTSGALQECGPPELGSQGYPATLEDLVEGCKLVGPTENRKKFLRRIPVDPMTGTTEWGLRCAQDDSDSTSWCGKDVYDVYTKHGGKALDGKTLYKDW